MKKILLALAIAVLFISCKKQEAVPPLEASFTFSNKTGDEIKLGTGDTTRLVIGATNATGANWDFGDGRTSMENSLILSYPKSGSYNLTLTVKGANGSTSSITKKVIVLDRVLKNIVINRVYWNNTDAMFKDAGWPLTEKADLFIKIQVLQGNDVFLPNGELPNTPVVYTSPVIKDVVKDTQTEMQINVANKFVVEKSLIESHKYVVSLVAKNASGEYVLFNNLYSGSEEMIKADDLTKNRFAFYTSFFSAVTLNAVFQ